MRITCLVCLLLLPGAAFAAQADEPADFFFDEPRFSIAVRGSRVFARANSDLFDFFSEQLTIQRRDFDAPAIGGEFGVALTRRVELVVGFEYMQSTIDSQYRQFVRRSTGAPIRQVTSLKTLEIGAGVKYALLGRGLEISRFAWVPRRLTPYVGAGAGITQYRLVQDGDFVDIADRTIFSDLFESRGWAPSAHAFAGLDIKLLRWLYASAEARYVWSAADLQESFVDFEPIDLSGVRTTAGVNIRF